MPPSTDHLTVTSTADPERLQPVLRHAVTVVILAALLVAVALLPGAGRTLPGTAVTVGGLATTTVALGLVATLLYANRSVSALVEAHLDGPADVVDDVASAAGNAVGFVAVLVAHWGLAPTVVPLLEPGQVWAYDVAFLGVALLPVAAAALRLFRNADALADHLAGAIRDWRSAGVDGAPDGEQC